MGVERGEEGRRADAVPDAVEPVRRLPLAPFWKAQRKLARELAEEACLEPNELVYSSGVTLEPGGKRALVTFALTREVLVVDLGAELTWSLLPLEAKPPMGEGFLGGSWTRAYPTASPEMWAVEDAHLGGGGMDPASTVGLVNVKTRARVLNLTDSKFCEGTVAWRLSPNRRWLAASWYDDRPRAKASRVFLRVFDTRDGTLAHELALPPDDDFHGQLAVAVDDAGTSVAFADERGVRLLEMKTGKVALQDPTDDVCALVLTRATLVIDGRKTRFFDRERAALRGTLEGVGRLLDVRAERAVWWRRGRAGLSFTGVDLTTAEPRAWLQKGAFGPVPEEGAEWLAAHDLESGRTAVVSKKELVVIEPPR